MKKKSLNEQANIQKLELQKNDWIHQSTKIKSHMSMKPVQLIFT